MSTHEGIQDPYVLTVGDDGVNTDIHPGLVARAAAWHCYPSTARSWVGTDRETRRQVDLYCVRCSQCDGQILPADLAGRIAHLTLEHGYRMDGLRYDNHNEVIPDA